MDLTHPTNPRSNVHAARVEQTFQSVGGPFDRLRAAFSPRHLRTGWKARRQAKSLCYTS